MCAQLLQLCLTLCDPMDCSWPGSLQQGYWHGLPFPSPGDLPDPGTEPTSPASPALQMDSLLLSHQGSPIGCRGGQSICLTYVRIDLKRHPGVRAALVNSGEESGI